MNATRSSGSLGAWAEAIAAAFSLARAERMRELRGDRTVKRFDSEGVHPYSVEWGRILALEALDDSLSILRFTGDPYCTPRALRLLAFAQAEADYEGEILARKRPLL